MTTDTLGPCPPRYDVIERLDCWPEDWPAWAVDVIEREREIAEWWKRRAERAEALLKDAMHRAGHICYSTVCTDVDDLRARVAAHFAEVKP